ncbi:MAG: hypothetical protein COA32_05395 [Fluviicola sp.]|nr:MAG: hypothetical protein COA32_05395 [Fluviicola sp.]
MIFRIIIGILLIGISCTNLKKSESFQEKSDFIILSGNVSCKDCIHEFLKYCNNKKRAKYIGNIKVGYLDQGEDFSNYKTELSLRDLFDIPVVCLSSNRFLALNDTLAPVIIKVNKVSSSTVNDTTIYHYHDIFTKTGSIDETKTDILLKLK